MQSIQSIDYVNDVDPITLESVEDILPENLIRLKVGEKLLFYNVQALYKWVKINPIDPTTKISFGRCQMNKIKRIYYDSTYQNFEKCISNFCDENLHEINELVKTLDLSFLDTINFPLDKMLDNLSPECIDSIDKRGY